MAILKFDDSLWPLAVTVAQGSCDLQMHKQSLENWNTWFAHKKPFCVLRVYLDEPSLVHPKGAGPITQQWLAEGAAENMQELVQAMLIVVPPCEHERMSKMSVQKAFGIDGAILASIEQAIDWLAAKNLLPDSINTNTLDALITKQCSSE
ncbi:hypothetical protein PSECIP111854_00705 [Pseudoalteromonas sp. CIP111854]|uniref:Uncharacterized protein n=1 Tax=Pseudoalteromonas holothuriae TaxID=2963714 RepID=A0A9W4QSG3_9GAMM|nr:hypothetical protein [Pseudoalteromonas sp. CIP111854]CAH9051236.1 hypothetical protein PSECIP111854_00705 [Pseudoalteromonas sp. CIP111854]